jgi:hypothetical protein
MFPHQFKKLIETLHAELGAIQKAIGEAIKKQDDAASDAKKAAEKTGSKPIRAIIESGALGTVDELNAENSRRDKEYTQQERLIFWTRNAFIAAAIYAGIAAVTLIVFLVQLGVMNRTYCQIQSQTTLMRQETIGNQGAVLVFDPSIAFEAGLGSGTISFAVRAVAGRVAARNVTVDLTVQRLALPSKKPIGKPIQCNVSVPQIVGTDPLIMLLSGQARACDLPGFDQKVVDEIMFTRQSVSISGSFGYENGFGEVFHQNLCRTYLAYKFSGFITPGRSISGQDSSFHDCSDFDRALNRAEAYKKRYKDDYVAGSFP